MGVKAKHHGSNSIHQKPNPAPTCMEKMRPFFDNLKIYKDIARQLQTNADFLMALSSMESGWLDPHNQVLHNLFGVTKAGGNNLSFASYQACADYWVQHFGSYVKGTTTMDQFVEGLKKSEYNSVNPNYYTHLKNQLKTIEKYKKACGVN
ncbi:MAG: glucosaminidase domain-containing protein [Thioploca sp.]|nr:glucosaminidase domain-containing protein [Thioploca sp.]